MKSLGKILSRQDDQSNIISDVTNSSSLSWKTRVTYFSICFAFSIFLSVLAAICVFTQKFAMFAALFSFGSIMAIVSTFFLMGPIKQMKKMADPNRWVASLIAITMIVMTLISAFHWKKGGLCLLFVVFQYLALTWYALSYIPYARSALKKCCTTCLV